MKIGFVLDDTLDKTDGVQQYALTLGGWLARQGHEVHYIVGQSTRTDIPNVHSVARNVPVTFNGNKLTIPLPASPRKLKKLLEELQLDILHIQMPYSPLMAARVIKYAGPQTGIVGTFHILPFSKLEQVATRGLGVWLTRSLKRFDAIYAVSGAAQKFAEKSFRIQAGVLPNVVDVAAFQVKPPLKLSDNHMVSFLGRLVPRKGAMELLKAVTLLTNEVQDKLTVRIGGKGALLPELEAYVKQHKLTCVEFVGFVAEEDKAAFLADSTIAVFPSLGGESFGIVLIEAMAARAGVVMGGNNPGYLSVLGGWPDAVFNPSDAPDFAQKLQYMLDHVSERLALHASQQVAVQAYDVNVVGAQWEHIYSQALLTANKVR